MIDRCEVVVYGVLYSLRKVKALEDHSRKAVFGVVS
jgi:hypothetical protein